MTVRQLIVSAISLAVTVPAFGHGLRLFVAVEGTAIQGRASYDNGDPVSGQSVQVLDSEGNSVAELLTNDEGQFTFEPGQRVTHKFIVETLDGHRATATVPAFELSTTPGADSAPAASETETISPEIATELDAIQRRLTQIQEALQEHEEQVRVQDVVAGVGFILGVMGVIAYMQYRNRPGSDRDT